MMTAGCRSHKESTAAISAVISDTLRASQVKISNSEAQIISSSVLAADSADILFSADSIKTGDKVIYGPRLSSSLHNPSHRSAAAASELSSNLTDTNIDASHNARANHREHTVGDSSLRSPVNLGILICLAAILIIGAVMILRHYVRLSH